MSGISISVSIQSLPESDCRVFVISGTMDAVTSQQVDDQLLPVINDGKANVVLDLSDLKYVSSAGIMCLIRYHVLMMNKQKKLKLVRPPGPVHDTLQIAGIAKYFSIYDNVQAAIAALR